VPLSKVELYAAIRHDARVEGLSSRALSAKYGVGRRTVALALESVWPAPRKQLPPRISRLDPFKATIDGILREDLDVPRKQRHTVKRVFDRLIDEHDARGVTYSMVRAYIFQRRPEIRVEEGRVPPQAFVPQTHRPGDEAEVDFGDVWIHLNGVSTKVFLFSLRLSFSGKAVHKIFAPCGQEAFLEGHVHALQVLGGVPRGKVRYDNLRAAVSQVLGRTRGRVESDRWTAFRSHFSINSFYCNPGIEGAHEKGGVEGQIGWFRRNHLVPVPKVASLAELNAMVERWDEEDDARRIMQRALTIGEMFAVERPLLVLLPQEAFETGLVSALRVDRYSQVSVRTNHYSVPVRLIGQMVRVVLHASELVVYEAHKEVARHRQGRLPAGAGPLPGGPGPQARRAARGDRAGPGQVGGQVHPGPRRLVAGGLHRPRRRGGHPGARLRPAAAPAHGPRARGGRDRHRAAGRRADRRRGRPGGPQAGRSRPGRRTADRPDIPPRRVDGGATVTSLTERRLAVLPPDPRPLPSVAVYDQLLRFRRRPADGQAYQEEAP